MILLRSDGFATDRDSMDEGEIRKRVADILKRKGTSKEAVDELATIGPAVIPALLDKLKPEDFPDVRQSLAALVIPRLKGDERLIPVLRGELRRAIRERNVTRETYIVLFTGALGNAGAISVLAESISDIGPTAQSFAVAALGLAWEKNQKLSKLVVPALVRVSAEGVAGGKAEVGLSTGSYTEIRIEALDLLGQIGDKDPETAASAMPALIAAWKAKSQPPREIPSDLPMESAKKLREIQMKEEANIREISTRAYNLIAEFGDARSIPGLIEELRKGDGQRRADAAFGLGRIAVKSPENTAKAYPALLEAAKDPNAKVRLFCIRSLGGLGKIPGVDLVPVLVNALKETDAQIRIAAIEGLSRVGDRRALPELRRIYKSDHGKEGDKAYEVANDIMKRTKPTIRRPKKRLVVEEPWKITRNEGKPKAAVR